ncbi:hyaluronoglucosaminidase, partial [gut metagenome]
MIYSQSPNKRLIEQINPWLIQFEFLGKTGTSALHMAYAWYEKDRAYTWQRYLETSALLDSMRLINHTLNQKAQPKGVKVGSRVVYPFILELFHQTGRNLLSTSEKPASEININEPVVCTNIDQLKEQPLIFEDNTAGFVPLLEVVKVQPGQYFGIGWEKEKEAESFIF